MTCPHNQVVPQTELVVFDVAGTTVYDADFVGRCLQEALAAAGLELTITAINPVMGMPKPTAIRQLLDDKGHGADVDAVYRDFVRRMTVLYESSDQVRPIEGAESAFVALRSAGVQVALDTGFSREVLNVVLARLGWGTGVLDATVASDEVENGRPHPDLVYRAMDLCGVSRASAVAKVGDTPSDLYEGTAAGCGLVVGVLSGTHTMEELEQHPHTHLVESVRDVPGLVLGGAPLEAPVAERGDR